MEAELKKSGQDQCQIDPNQEFTFAELSKLILSSGIVDIKLDLESRVITINNRSDLHRFMIATGVAKPVLDNDGKLSVDENGILRVEKFDYRVQILDSSEYGQPYLTHPVRFQIGIGDPWKILANHRVLKPE